LEFVSKLLCVPWCRCGAATFQPQQQKAEEVMSIAQLLWWALSEVIGGLA
jgi:hypothetical protein